MNFQRQVNRRLDEEHRANLDLLTRFERALARGGDAPGPEMAGLAATLGRALEHEVAQHFAFEERELFPRMVEAGDGDMAALLLEDHAAIRAVAGELKPLLAAAAAGKLDGPGWSALRRAGVELAERLTAHIDKETMGLLPLCEELIDEDTDRELAFAYAVGG